MGTVEPADVRQRILSEATRLFVACGYHGLSMREIAEAVHVSKAGLYYHFRDKEELFIAILNGCLDELEVAIATATATPSDTRTQIEAILRAIFALPPAQRAVIRLASSELAHIGAEQQAIFRHHYYEQFIGRIEAVVQGGLERGELRQMDTRIATWLLLGMAYPFFTPSDPRAMDVSEATIAMIVTVFFDGAANR